MSRSGPRRDRRGARRGSRLHRRAGDRRPPSRRRHRQLRQHLQPRRRRRGAASWRRRDPARCARRSGAAALRPPWGEVEVVAAELGNDAGVLGAAGARPVSGALVVCPTPIGNLADVTLRLLDELRGADVVACEDTRRTRILLDRHGIAVPVLAVHEHNEARARARARGAHPRGRAGGARHRRRHAGGLGSRRPHRGRRGRGRPRGDGAARARRRSSPRRWPRRAWAGPGSCSRVPPAQPAGPRRRRGAARRRRAGRGRVRVAAAAARHARARSPSATRTARRRVPRALEDARAGRARHGRRAGGGSRPRPRARSRSSSPRPDAAGRSEPTDAALAELVAAFGSRRAAALASRLTGVPRNRLYAASRARSPDDVVGQLDPARGAHHSAVERRGRRAPQKTHASCGLESTIVSPRTLISSGSRTSIPNLRRISTGITIRPSSSTLRTTPPRGCPARTRVGCFTHS